MRRLVLVLLLVPTAFFALPAGVSGACTCAATNRAQATANADVVFKGTVTDMADPEGGGNVISSGREVVYAFDVDNVAKGVADDPARVATAAEGASCGAAFAIGGRYLVFATEEGDRLTSSLCSGNEDLPALPAADRNGESDDPEDALFGEPGEGGVGTRTAVLVTLGALAAAGAVVAIGFSRNRQRAMLDDLPGRDETGDGS